MRSNTVGAACFLSLSCFNSSIHIDSRIFWANFKLIVLVIFSHSLEGGVFGVDGIAVFAYFDVGFSVISLK